MHENGRRLQTRQYRTNTDGEEVMVHSAEVDYYSFLQAGFHVITNNDSVTIQVRVFFFWFQKTAALRIRSGLRLPSSDVYSARG